MTEPSTEQRPPDAAHEHPPFRLRERRRLLLPDLSPPTLDELRWAARQRRVRRGSFVPQPRPADLPVESLDPHVERAEREQADVATATDEQVLDEVIVEPPAHETIDLVAAESAARVVLPDPEPVASERVAEDLPPLVSQVLVVREPLPVERGQIAVLEDVQAAPATVTRLVPLPAVEDLVATDEPDELGYDEVATDDEAETEDEAHAAPLYWRLLRLRHTRPNGWLRALYFEGSVALAVVLVLAEVASVWTIVVLPFVVAVVVKANDVLAGSLRRTYRQPVRRRDER